MRFADYYRIQADVAPSDDELRDALRADMTSPSGIDAAVLDSALRAPMWASCGADVLEGSHPLVLWSYRDSVPTMQPLMNEYLASHGYVVAFAWPKDRLPPYPWQEGLTPVEKLLALSVQVGMLEGVLDALLSRPSIDGAGVSVLAWSYGGESADELQRRRDEIRLLIGVDATIVSGWVYRPGAETAIDRAGLSVPHILLRNGRPRIDGEPSSEPTLLAEVPAGSWFVRFPHLLHGNFNFPGGMLPGVLGIDEVSAWAVGGDTARLGYETIARHVLGVLDVYHRDAAVDPSLWSGQAPEGFVEVVRHRPDAERRPAR